MTEPRQEFAQIDRLGQIVIAAGLHADHPIDLDEFEALNRGVLKAYRWQYIISGAEHPQFAKVLGEMITEQQGERIGAALAQIN